MEKRVAEERILFSIAFSGEDKSKVACGSSIGQIAVFNWRSSLEELRTTDISQGRVSSNSPVSVFKGHTGPIYSVTSIEDKVLATASNSEVKLWNWANLNCLLTLKPPPLPANADVFLSNPEINGLCSLPGNSVVGACGDNCAHVWDCVTGTVLQSFIGHSDYLHCVTGWGDHAVITGSEDGTVRIWDRRQPHAAAVLCPDRSTSEVTDGELGGSWIGSADAKDDWLVCGGGSGIVSVWNIGVRRACSAVSMPNRVPVTRCLIGDNVTAVGHCPSVMHWSIGGKLINNEVSSSQVLYDVQISDDGVMVACGSSNMVDVFATKTHLTAKIPFPCQ